MTEEPRRHSSIDLFGEDLERAGEQHIRQAARRRRLRGVAVAVVALAALVPGLLLVQGGSEQSRDAEPRALEGEREQELGVLDPRTGELLRCPDGELFTVREKAGELQDPEQIGQGGEQLAPSQGGELEPVPCNNGSIPNRYDPSDGRDSKNSK